jgi:HPt (histidine-containing phosphotransfer) domain-containing protein
MDYMMPDMDGVEATKFIHDAGVEVPIIALTASAITGTKEFLLASGMDGYLSKPILQVELKQILEEWLPIGKIIDTLPGIAAFDTSEIGEDKKFWERAGRIVALSLSDGISIAGGRPDTYEKTLRLMVREIDRCSEALCTLLSDGNLEDFRIEAHGVKSALANAGAIGLSENASELEIAAAGGDDGFCNSNLPAFLDDLNDLQSELREAFLLIDRSGEPADAPPGLAEILGRLAEAIAQTDLVRINAEMIDLNDIKPTGPLIAGIERIKDLVMIMEYERAAEMIQQLSDSTNQRERPESE